MSVTAQEMIDRRKLRRKLGFWRVLAILVVALAVIGAALVFGVLRDDGVGSGFAGAPSDQIARVSIEGLITEDEKLLDLLGALRDDDSVKAVILKIDSPGGTTVGGESIYEAVRKIASVKPVASEVGTLAASAGYMIAAGSDYIVAHRTSIVGSIGVLFQYVDASKLLDTIGVDVNAIKSSPMKAEPSPFAPAPQEAKDMIRRLILDTYDWFVALVAERRGYSPDEAYRLADGSVFSGRQALDNKLVDAIGGEEVVRQWLEGERGVAKGLDIVDRKPEKPGFGWSPFAGAKSFLLGFLGLSRDADSLPDALLEKAGRLDGLVSLWQPSS